MITTIGDFIPQPTFDLIVLQAGIIKLLQQVTLASPKKSIQT